MAEKTYLVVGPLFDVKVGDRYLRTINGGTVPPGADRDGIERGLRRGLIIETDETGGLPQSTVAAALANTPEAKRARAKEAREARERKAAAEREQTEREAAEKAAAERVQAEKEAAEKAEAERLAAEKAAKAGQRGGS